MTVLAIRWLVLARDEETPLLHAAAGAALDAMKFASGVALAVLAHLVQLGFYFDSFEAASRDLLGSAAARANAGGASQINPEYGRFIAADTARLEHAYSQRADLAPIFSEGFDFEDPPRLNEISAIEQPQRIGVAVQQAYTVLGIEVVVFDVV